MSKLSTNISTYLSVSMSNKRQFLSIKDTINNQSIFLTHEEAKTLAILLKAFAKEQKDCNEK